MGRDLVEGAKRSAFERAILLYPKESRSGLLVHLVD